MRGDGLSLPKRLHIVIACRRAILSLSFRPWCGITADDILRAAGTVEDVDDVPINGSALLGQVVMPALAEAERSFAITLGHISVEDLVHSAEGLRKSAE